VKEKLFSLLAVVATCMLLTGCWGRIETGNVGVRTNFNGKVDQELVREGLYFAFLSSVDEYTTKEIPIDLENMQPKAKDNLSLKDLDVTVRYQVAPNAIRGLVTTKTNSSAKKNGVFWPGYSIVSSVAKSEISDVVASMDSLTIHTKRTQLEERSKAAIQKSLDMTDPGVFKINQVIVKQVTTDPTIENAIRNVVAKDKELQAAKLGIEIAEANAAATQKTAQALTPAFLQHEYNQVLMEFAKHGNGNTLILDGSGSAKLLQVAR